VTDKAPTPDNDDFEDLDALITSRALEPKKIKLFGRRWTLRRDFDAKQMAQFWALTDKTTALGKVSSEAMAMLVGDKDGEAFAEQIGVMPGELMNPIIRRIYVQAGLLKRNDDTKSGESPAS
jgi:hypothetical protein